MPIPSCLASCCPSFCSSGRCPGWKEASTSRSQRPGDEIRDRRPREVPSEKALATCWPGNGWCKIGRKAGVFEYGRGDDPKLRSQAVAASLCLLLYMLPVAEAWSAVELQQKMESSVPSDTLENVPQTLSGTDKARRIQRPKSAQAETCTRKCLSTCIRGGAGAPGEGPLNVRRPLVVFKDGFRSRHYCLLECSEICNLIPDGQDGP